MIKSKSGFTIVELLIVIVVIAILAAISIAAYNGIQQRANNTKSITAAKQVLNLVQSYVATYGVAPLTANRCGTVDNICTSSSGVVTTSNNTDLMTELKKIGNPPESSNANADGSYGIQYIYSPSAMFNGSIAPIRIEYYLQGLAKKCELPNITTNAGNGNTSTTGYSQTSGNKTVCWSMIVL